MAVSYNQDTYKKAYKAAERAYEVIPQVNAAYARKNFTNKDKNQAIEELAEQIWPLVQQEYPEDNFTEGMADELAKSKDDDWFRMWWLEDKSHSPRVKAEQDRFEKFQDLVVDGKWYNMPQKELDLKMAELGFDPTNRESRKQFLDVLSQHQINYDRGNIVKDEMGSWDGIVASLTAPTITREAVRQSMTGDFDDDKIRGAGITDLVATGLLGGASMLKGAVAPAAGAMAVETGRQFANKGFGNETDWGDPMMAAMFGASVPMIGSKVAGGVKRAATMEAKPFVRGFNRGLRGTMDDPLAAERNNLKQMLIAGREQSQNATTEMEAGGHGPGGFTTNIAGAESAGDYAKAETALRALGIPSRRTLTDLEGAVARAKENLELAKNPPAPVVKQEPKVVNGMKVVPDNFVPVKQLPPPDVDKKLVMLAEKELASAEKDLSNYKKTVADIDIDRDIYAEDVLGANPTSMQPGPVTLTNVPTVDVEAVLSGRYDRPVLFNGLTKTGVPDAKFYESTADTRRLIKDAFPEKYSKELGSGKNPRAYTLGLNAGRVTNDLVKPVAVTTHLAPSDINEIVKGTYSKDKIEQFKQAEWFQNLPKEKKLAIERALKGEK